MRATREQVLASRVRAQQLDRPAGTLADTALSDTALSDTALSDTALSDTAVLDAGVQDTGPEGARWALLQRGLDVAALPHDALVRIWSLRGAPHVYRRADLPSVAAALEPWSEADAAQRILDAAKPLRAAGLAVREAMDHLAGVMREVVTAPMVKGEMSARLTERLPEPYLRSCVPCGAIHPYEQPFRLAALRAGLVLQPGTSPPVLEPLPGFAPAPAPDPRHDLVRVTLRLLGPLTPAHVAAHLDAPVRDVRARWPADAVEVEVGAERRWLLPDDADRLTAAGPVQGVWLLGSHDLLLQARDRDLLAPDPEHARELWPALGRPGAVLVDGEVAGTWRARKGRGLGVAVRLWSAPAPRLRAGLAEQAERLAAYRGQALGELEVTG